MENIYNKMICKICGNSENNQLYEFKEMMFGFRDKFDYFQCPHCDCLQILDLFLDMAKYYPSNYDSFISEWGDLKKSKNSLVQYLKDCRNDYAIFNKGLLGRIIYKKFPFKWLKEYLSNYFSGVTPVGLFKKKSKILDVGCGSGKLLYLLRELGFKNLLGADPYNKDDILYSNGVKILKLNIHQVRGKFDLIMFHHSFEHMADPIETLKSTSRLLAKNGKCLIRIPIVDSYAWHKYKKNWVALDPPRHFFLHSLKSMEILAMKAEFNIIKIAYDSTDFQFWGSEQYLRDIPLMSDISYSSSNRKGIFSEDEIRKFKETANKLNDKSEGDCAAFLFEKI